ncbi:T9SS type A sorting domain-containing protein [Chryseobacterium rhizoplanae]|uniref:T9SS C-terminal target domain-containing protein n=1 Tax=Chryseobacterium bernardetii TaxID=1241978 RepID=A0A3G6TBB5_9FLAO|nr:MULTISPECIES: T9SS type A sorting domain-containing protein [Chryseobacterium]AZB26531.1 T9SS C-terminal target domain-containing protein [Chryseobacterium bernardetii]UCA60807.1 T9SS type A sorting domain-containing protein [Chryseobacterium rhizoplanae]
MKKIYSIACSLLAMFCFAQQAVSFEDNEGFIAGNIHGQGAWISTPTGGNPENVIHQTISTDNATDGSSALKIVRESVYGVQTEPVIGGFYNLAVPLFSNHFSVSFDINMSQLNGSVFGFQGVNNINEQTIIRVDFDKTGIINILSKISGVQSIISTSGLWLPGTWYRFKVVGTAMDIRYYLNDTLIYAEAVNGPLAMDQLRFVHNNGLGIAYFDNIKINNELLLSVKEAKANAETFTVYPNPVEDILYIKSKEKADKIEIYDTSGRKMSADLNENQVNVKNLDAGSYIIKIVTKVGKTTGKFIKK